MNCFVTNHKPIPASLMVDDLEERMSHARGCVQQNKFGAAMQQRLRLRGIWEVPIGTDEVLGRILHDGRIERSLSQEDIARETGAHIEEIRSLEKGAIAAFSDHDRLREIILAYCDFLQIDPAPILARLATYSRWQTLRAPAPSGLAAELLSRVSPRVSRLIFIMTGLLITACAFAIVFFLLPV